MAKKKPFQDRRANWYMVIGKKKPRPFSEKVLKKAVKAIKKAKREAAQKQAEQDEADAKIVEAMEKARVKVHTPDFVEKLADDLAADVTKVRVRKV
jgi:hypothetical protein